MKMRMLEHKKIHMQSETDHGLKLIIQSTESINEESIEPIEQQTKAVKEQH